MNKKFIIIGVVLVVVLIAAAAFFYVTVIGPRTATLAHVDDLHMKMSASSLGELEAIIRNNVDPYTRERAVNIYTDIALHSQNSKRALAFLKELAIEENNTDVRTSAYTNYYFIREETHVPPETTVDVKVIGDIRPGNDIRVVFDVTSLRGSNLSQVGMEARQLKETNITTPGDPRIMAGSEVDANSGKGALTNVVITPSSRVRRPLPANVTVEFPYTVSIKGPGQVMLQTLVEVRYDQLDYDTVKKTIFLDVGQSGGSYIIRD